MNINNKEKNINTLEKIKNKIKEQEEIILKSKMRQTKIENKIIKLEYIKEKILNKKKWRLRTIFSYITYDIVMISLLIFFIMRFINILPLSRTLELSLYIIQLYIGVAVISISGAYIFTKLDVLLNNYINKKKLAKITKLIHDKEEKLKLEINTQELTKKEITNTLSDNMTLNEFKEDFINSNYRKSNVHEKKDEANHKIRIRKI